MEEIWRLAGRFWARAPKCFILEAMIYRFDHFELDMARFELRADGAVHPLEPQVFALLAYLIEHRERLVPKNELFEKLWDGRVVTDSALTSRIR